MTVANQAQVDRIEKKLDQLLELRVEDAARHANLEVRMADVEQDVDRISSKFWPMVGALSVLSPLMTGIFFTFFRGMINNG